jgi:N-acetylneuraminic acid mutarotase
MPTKRSAGAAIVLDGRIYIAGGRPPRGGDFAVYDPNENTWRTLPDMPTPRNHLAAAMIDGKIHVAAGRIGGGFQSEKSDAHSVFDPKTNAWSSAAPMLRPRSGVNGVMAFGCFHVWGGEQAEGLFPDHDYYDPRANRWTKLPDMPTPVHGVTGAVFARGLIYAIGGGTEPGGNSGSLLNQVYRPNVACQ